MRTCRVRATGKVGLPKGRCELVPALAAPTSAAAERLLAAGHFVDQYVSAGWVVAINPDYDVPPGLVLAVVVPPKGLVWAAGLAIRLDVEPPIPGEIAWKLPEDAAVFAQPCPVCKAAIAPWRDGDRRLYACVRPPHHHILVRSGDGGVR